MNEELGADLDFRQNLVLSYLVSLSQKKGFCYASNDHICTTLGIKNRTLYRVLNELEECNHIQRVTKSTGHYGKERKIYVSPSVKKAYNI